MNKCGIRENLESNVYYMQIFIDDERELRIAIVFVNSRVEQILGRNNQQNIL